MNKKTNSLQHYNCRVIHYPTGKHVTFYFHSYTKGKEIEKYHVKNTKSENRNEEMEKHCKAVSLSSTKRRIYNLARSNNWEWFLTLTFDRNITDSSNYEEVLKKLQDFLKRMKKRRCPDMKYLIVPELHKDGLHYHFHGLLSDIDGMRMCYSGHDDKNGTPVFNVLDWKLGFSTVTRVKDSARASGYISKYITKESQQFFPCRHRYFASMNLVRAQETTLLWNESDFQREFCCKIKWCKSLFVKKAMQNINYYEIDA